MRTIGLLTLLVLALAVSVGLTACGGGGSSATPEEQLCSALDDFEASVAAVKDLNVSSTSLDQVQEAIGNVVDSAKDVADAAKDVTSADVSELQASATSLSAALADFPSAGSIQAITAGISTIGEAGQQAIDDLDCDTSS